MARVARIVLPGLPHHVALVRGQGNMPAVRGTCPTALGISVSAPYPRGKAWRRPPSADLTMPPGRP